MVVTLWQKSTVALRWVSFKHYTLFTLDYNTCSGFSIAKITLLFFVYQQLFLVAISNNSFSVESAFTRPWTLSASIRQSQRSKKKPQPFAAIHTLW